MKYILKAVIGLVLRLAYLCVYYTALIMFGLLQLIWNFRWSKKYWSAFYEIEVVIFIFYDRTFYGFKDYFKGENSVYTGSNSNPIFDLT